MTPASTTKMHMVKFSDDIILAGKSESKLKEVKNDHSRKFDTKDLGNLRYFLGMKIEQNEQNGSVWIGQLPIQKTC